MQMAARVRGRGETLWKHELMGVGYQVLGLQQEEEAGCSAAAPSSSCSRMSDTAERSTIILSEGRTGLFLFTGAVLNLVAERD